MNFLIRLLVSALAVMVLAYVLPGVEVNTFLTAIAVAVVLALLNAIVKPILIFFTIPITVLTLGLFLLVINATIILLAGRIVPGFEIENFWWALIFGILLSLINSLFQETERS